MDPLRDGYNNEASTKTSHIQYQPWHLEITGNYSGIWQRFPRKKHIKYCKDTEVEPEQECLKSDMKWQM